MNWHYIFDLMRGEMASGIVSSSTVRLLLAAILGGLIGWLWQRFNKPSYDRYVATLASGFIGGEALLGGLILPAVAPAVAWLSRPSRPL